jgi:antitoxin component of MazEF toxin-antitoxin module
MEVTTKPKKWGNSIGIIIPKEAIEREKITLKDELILHIEKKSNKEKDMMLKEGYIEMAEEMKKLGKEWGFADIEGWP